MELLQRADFELALLVAGVLVIAFALVLIVRRAQPPRTTAAPTTSSALPADLAAIEAKIKAVEGRVSEVEHGINQVRTMMGALPTKDSVNGIALAVKGLEGDIRLNNFQTAATAKAVERIENWLMEEAQRKAEVAKAAKTEGEKGGT